MMGEESDAVAPAGHMVSQSVVTAIKSSPELPVAEVTGNYGKLWD